jgi:hypothetical protein
MFVLIGEQSQFQKNFGPWVNIEKLGPSSEELGDTQKECYAKKQRIQAQILLNGRFSFPLLGSREAFRAPLRLHP